MCSYLFICNLCMRSQQNKHMYLYLCLYVYIYVYILAFLCEHNKMEYSLIIIPHPLSSLSFSDPSPPNFLKCQKQNLTGKDFKDKNKHENDNLAGNHDKFCYVLPCSDPAQSVEYHCGIIDYLVCISLCLYLSLSLSLLCV